MKPSTYVKTTVIQVYKQINSSSFENGITYKLFTYKSYIYIYICVCVYIYIYIYIHLTVCKQMTDVKLLLLYSNI